MTCQVLGHLLKGDLWLLPLSPCLLISLTLMAFLGLRSRFQEGPFMPDLMEMTAASAQSLRLSDSWKLWLFPLLPALNEMVFHGLWVLTREMERRNTASSSRELISWTRVGQWFHRAHPDTSTVNGQPAVFSHETAGILATLYLLSLPPCLISSLCPLLTALELQPSISP